MASKIASSLEELPLSPKAKTGFQKTEPLAPSEKAED